MVELERERKRRNLVPARLGIYGIWVFAFHQISEQFAYNAFRRSKVNVKEPKELLGTSGILTLKNPREPYKTKTKEMYLKRLFQIGMDCSIRALIVAVATDTYICLFCPLLTLFACPAVRRNVAFLSNSRSIYVLSSSGSGQVQVR